MLSSREILEKYLNFYKDRSHKQVPNVSLVPQNDPTLLFVNSGMFPLVPYLSGEPHPLGKRLVNVQRCLRFGDLPDIGDATHTIAFHMIGNWSLGDYFKKDQLPWVYEIFIDVLGLDPKKLVATVFAGDANAPRDEESVNIIKEVFKKYGVDADIDDRIWLYSKEQGNWWQRGEAVGELGGPSSEVFYYLGEGDPSGKSPEKHESEFVEIGNSVFMEYKRSNSGWEKLPQSNVDFGGGFERIALAVQNKRDIYETDNFWPIIQKIESLSGKSYKEIKEVTVAMRILADHVRACTFLAMDGVTPSNKDQGYVLRRLLRRMVRAGRVLGVEKDISTSLVPIVAEMFGWIYPELQEKRLEIEEVFSVEEAKFRKTLLAGSKEVSKRMSHLKLSELSVLDLGNIAFDVYQSLGYPVEMFIEDIKDLGSHANLGELEQFIDQKVKEHQQGSRSGAEHKFKGGLADHSENTIRYHTATHLLHKALRQVLGESIVQQGSNITGERLRFDFNYNVKLTEVQLSEITNIVNDSVTQALPVNFEIMSKDQAEKTGAIHAFGEKYGDEVKVYYIGETLDTAVSKEFCGGPHVSNTKEIGLIDIYKQERLGDGKMRLYAKFAS